ncbi:flippase-like domain-containing protein [Alloacidobacterium dinghuense]|uniref:Bifunctional IPC transferase and DIPP synthase n=1 Tax=Alloacidobacterium dinghuense TaxID=2763107 RepID=A0A7G8BLM7_9BACT|nr:lysylphosphatidylglycerol synthase domain-containing protein [Alloacidobacterium dinghuense]QNI33447.1 flippase-like domain-containing protein [Alloacidobacterium dinghuense]
MLRPKARGVATLHIVTAILGLALLGYLVRRVGLEALMQSVSNLGWGLLLIIALGGLSHLVKTWAWRFTLMGSGSSVSFARLFQLRLASEAAGLAGALGQFFGEGLRISAISRDMPVDNCVVSVTFDRTLFMITGGMVSVAGIFAALFMKSMTPTLRFYAVLFALVLLILVCLPAIAVMSHWPVLSASARRLTGIPYLRTRLGQALPLISSVENKLFNFHRRAARSFWASLSLNLLCHALAVMEVYLILWLLGTRIGLQGSFVFEAVTKLVNAVGSLNPGNIGTYEGGNILIARMFSLPVFIGLSVAVARRLRAIFWAGAGILCLLLISRRNTTKRADDYRETVDNSESTGAATSDTCRSINAVIFAGRTKLSLLKIAEIPILLRNILSARRAGATRVIVCLDPDAAAEAQHQLMQVRSLSYVEWLDLPIGGRLRQLLQEFTAETENSLLLVDGNCIYHPAVFRQACKWGQDGALSLISAEESIGMHVLSASFAHEAADRWPQGISSLDELCSWIATTGSIQYETVAQNLWQRVASPEKCLAGERKLDHWLVKPTDGVFARMNRRVSVPISRRIIKLPVTPNVVTLFTLGVGFTAGMYFARGGYWNMLIGAILSVWASIFDGCDGEVARLKLMESDFGCWLETICDWLYYLFIFAGIAIGLSKAIEDATFIAWGSALLFGAAMTFLVTGLGRHRYASAHPEQYLKLWQASVERRRSNPILYIGRNTEFIVRRCFMPYALLAFAALNIMKVAFFLFVVGANLAWLIALYSYWSFAPTVRPELRNTAEFPGSG